MQISPEQETVWLTQKQIEQLFDVKHAVVSEHISNILSSGKLDETSVGFSDKRLLSVFPTKVPEEENQRFIILI